jgi:hypothetical protein
VVRRTLFRNVGDEPSDSPRGKRVQILNLMIQLVPLNTHTRLDFGDLAAKGVRGRTLKVWNGKWNGTTRGTTKSRKSLLLRITGAKSGARTLNPAITLKQIVTTSLAHRKFVVGQSGTDRRRGRNHGLSCIRGFLITKQAIEILVNTLPRVLSLLKPSCLPFAERRFG